MNIAVFLLFFVPALLYGQLAYSMGRRRGFLDGVAQGKAIERARAMLLRGPG